MLPSSTRRSWWRSLGAKLLLSYLAVVLVGIVTVLLAANLAAPTFFANSMDRMMGAGGMASMMGQTGAQMAQEHASQLDAALQASFRDALTQALTVAGVAATLAAIGAGVYVTGRVVAPIRRQVAASRRIAAGNYAERVPIGSDDELGDLAASFNAMAAALETTEQRRLDLIGDVAHEMRTPVATLRGYLEGVIDGVVEDSERTWMKLLDETGRLGRLIDDLQELSRAEAGQLPLNLLAVDPADIARAALDRLSVAFSEIGLALEPSFANDLPPVLADKDRAVQVLTNLLTNALRYTPPPGTVQLSVQRAANAVEFVVADSGVGIAAEHLPHVFERFYRVDKSRSRARGGSGIGLTIARALVEAMGGRIWARSDGPGRGATFGFSLPLAS
jgi:signal transduction histidine kinase